ncbi:MAG: hypothetical protein HOW73_14620 [Polyangiaceae bacterium]|nr:hypothetical protein [Polyangiaceae bacterium]
MPTRPIVLCTIDRLGLSGLSELRATTSALETADGADAKIVVTRAELDVLPEEAAHYALGTGEARPDPKLIVDELVEKERLFITSPLDDLLHRLEMERGTFIDFMTQKERERCRLHVFCRSSEAVGKAHALPVVALMRGLELRNLPFVVHAILDGPEKTAQSFLELLTDNLGPTGKLGSIIGADHVLGSAIVWERSLVAYQCIVRAFSGLTVERFYEPLANNYSDGGTDQSVPPTRIGEYDGVTGSLQADFAPSGESRAQSGEMPANAWQWHGSDVGIVVTERGDDLVPLVSLLLRENLPDDVAANVTINGRDVFAFDKSSLISLTRIGPLSVRPMIETRCATPGLFGRLSAAGKHAVKIFEASRRVAATFTFEGEPETPAPGIEEATSELAIRRATEVVQRGEMDFVHVAVDKPSDANATESFDLALRELIDATVEASGQVFLVTDGPVMVHARGAGDHDDVHARTHREVFANVLEACGVAVDRSRLEEARGQESPGARRHRRHR